VKQGWSRNILAMQIQNRLYERQAAALTNFASVLPAPWSDLARALVKSPYNFDFLGIGPDAREREVEQGLLEHVRSFLLELGAGFALVGSQYHLDVGGDDFYLDLLFYHLVLRCYIVIDLKAGKFQPEYAGKMNFYLSAVDEQLRDPEHDQPSIGILLCRDRNKLVAEYALRDLAKPVGISTYLTETLPATLAAALPSTRQLEAELTPDHP